MPCNALDRRLGRLERSNAPRGGPCPQCGHEPGAPVKLCVAPPRVIGEPDDPSDDPSRDICAACGFQWVYRVAPPRKIGFDDGFDAATEHRTLGPEKTPAVAGVGGPG